MKLRGVVMGLQGEIRSRYDYISLFTYMKLLKIINNGMKEKIFPIEESQQKRGRIRKSW